MDAERTGRRFGLIGFPVKHSFSAAMHNAAFAYYGMDAVYELFEVIPEQLADFFGSLPAGGICGLNVTIPHKERAVDFLRRQAAEVREIGAVNTVCVEADGTLSGFNTDQSGFARHIRELGITPRKTALFGAGGAAKAAAAVLAKSGTREISVYDIDARKSRALAQRIKKIRPECRIQAVDSVRELRVEEKDLFVNASPLGMKPEDPLPLPEQALHRELFVYDLIYNPAQTKLIGAARRRGLFCSNGLAMLLYQGMSAFEYWTKKEAPEKTMREALEKELNRG